MSARRWCLALVLAAACHHDGLVAGRPQAGDALDGGALPDLANLSDPATSAPCASATDEASCEALPRCRAFGCPTCAGTMTYGGCLGPGDSSFGRCSAPVGCPLPCSLITSGEACDARSDCYALYSGGGQPCGEAFCINEFRECRAGGALCYLPSDAGACPYTARCADGDVYAYDSVQCIIGCVHQKACGL